MELSGLKMKFRETPKQLAKGNTNESNTIMMVDLCSDDLIVYDEIFHNKISIPPMTSGK